MGSFLDSIARLIDSNLLAATLVDASLKGAVILLVSAGLVRLFKPTSASIRHLIRALALFALVSVPICRLLVPPWQVGILPASPWAGTEFISAPPTEASEVAIPASTVVETASPPDAESATIPSTSSTASGDNVQRSVFPLAVSGLWVQRWQTLVLLLWMAGTSFFLLRLLLGVASVHYAVWRSHPVDSQGWEALSLQASRRLNLTRPVRLLVSPGLEVALSVGLLRPVVLLPAVALTWSQSRRRSILLHEFSHAKRWDNLTNLIAQLACALHWFNPMVWATVKRLTVDRERACDDEVLATGTLPSDYAGHLLEIARAISSRRLWGRMEVSQSSALKDRLQAVLSPGLNRRRPSLSVCLTGVVLAAAGLVPLAALQPWIDAAALQPTQLAEMRLESSISTLRRVTGGQMDPAPGRAATVTKSSTADDSNQYSEQRRADFRSLLSWTRPQSGTFDGGPRVLETAGVGLTGGLAERDPIRRFSGLTRRFSDNWVARDFNSDTGQTNYRFPAVLGRTSNTGGDGSGNQGPPSDPGPVSAEVVRIDLGTLGGDASRALSINDLGLVVGESRKQSNLVSPFLWTARSGMLDLGNPFNTHTRAVQVNQSGSVLCETFNSTVFRGLVWTPAVGLVDIGSLDPSTPFTQVRAINQAGLVVGASRDKTGKLRAFVWSAPTGMLDLGIPGDSEAWAINDLGQIAGYTEQTFPTGVQTRAFFWDPAEGVRFIRPEGAPLSIATALNNKGEVVGYAEFEDGFPHAFLWSRQDGLVNLGMASSSFPITLATAINDLGQVVGQSLNVTDPEEPQLVRAFRWTASTGIRDIGASNGDSPLAINAVGQIVGAYLDDSVTDRPSAILWTDAGQVELKDADSTVTALNNRYQAVGSSLATDQERHAFLWEVRLQSGSSSAQQ